jgi:hypothetical protein
MSLYKSQGPIVVAFLTAIIVIASNFIDAPGLSQISSDVKNFGAIIAGFALFVGLIGIIQSHANNVTRKKPLWQYSVLLLAVLALFIGVGLVYGNQSSQFKWIYDTIYGPLTATTYSLLAFWVCSAAYRAFKPRSMESAILVVSGLLVFFGVQPIASVISPVFNSIQAFIMNVLNVAGTRGIVIGVGLGILGFGLRVLLGWEKSWMGAD